ncbi:hypothetical protein QCA50_017950 [Cerrena zonata]|uniref:DNA replication regulator Sld3 C-terminal domain-containing protein n=1 Tax=Cerrena zonata TaxID=2478898 RepID=A0AAW0FNP3_9APHY
MNTTASSSSDTTDIFRRVFQALLLTPRAASQKYHEHIPRLLVDEDAEPDLEANLLWYAVKYEKTEIGEGADEHQQELAEEKWKNTWLERVEKREVLIQIILHFLVLTRPEPPMDQRDPSPDPLPPSQSPRKRKRKAPPSDTLLPNSEIEDQLEAFMDKLCMWQLTSALDNITTGKTPGTNGKPGTTTQGNQKTSDERDWMQKFCEDVIEPIFKPSLPSHCSLLRSKVFPSSPFSDDSDPDDFPVPSDKRNTKHLKVSGSTSSSRRQSPSRQGMSNDRSLTRSRSLSVSLEQERARSRSQSIGPGNMKKRVLTREVSMSTVFKGKAEEARRKEVEKAKAVRSKKATQSGVRPKKDHGKTLVEATPVKPKGKDRASGQFSQKDGSKLPMFSVKEETGDEEDWKPLTNSPDILLLGSNSASWSDEEEEDGPDAFGTPVRKSKAGSRVLVDATPTKVLK